MRSGGGLIGFAVSAPLVAALTPWAAAPLLALVSGFGLLVITGTPLHRVPDRLNELRAFTQRPEPGADEADGAGDAAGGLTRPLTRGRKRPQAIEAGDNHRPYDTPIVGDGPGGPGAPRRVPGPSRTRTAPSRPRTRTRRCWTRWASGRPARRRPAGGPGWRGGCRARLRGPGRRGQGRAAWCAG